MSEKDALKLGPGDWAVYDKSGPAQDGPWAFGEVINSPDDPGGAARRRFVNQWTSGSHSYLVAGLEGSYVYRISMSCEEVPDAG